MPAPESLRRHRRVALIAAIGVGGVLVMLSWFAIHRAVMETQEAAQPPYSCSAEADRPLADVEAAVRAAARTDHVSTDLVAQLGDCDSGGGRTVEADLHPTTDAAERFLRTHFDCGRARKETPAIPPDVAERHDRAVEPVRVLACEIGGVSTEVTVYDAAEWDQALAGIAIRLAQDT